MFTWIKSKPLDTVWRHIIRIRWNRFGNGKACVSFILVNRFYTFGLIFTNYTICTNSHWFLFSNFPPSPSSFFCQTWAYHSVMRPLSMSYSFDSSGKVICRGVTVVFHSRLFLGFPPASPWCKHTPLLSPLYNECEWHTPVTHWLMGSNEWVQCSFMSGCGILGKCLRFLTCGELYKFKSSEYSHTWKVSVYRYFMTVFRESWTTSHYFPYILRWLSVLSTNNFITDLLL